MKKTVSMLAIWLCISQVFAQKTYTPEVLERINQVENGIVGDIIINDAPPDNILDRMAKYKVKGMSIAVIHDYKIEWAKGYGWADESEKRPVTTETLFEPGSISKTLNALGILKLAQEKRVDLDADINNYLTSWKFPYDSLSKGKKITLAQLLSHNAGLTVHGFPGHYRHGDIPTVFEVLDGKSPAATPAVRSEFEPDLRFQYSGGGTTISQVLLSDVTGQPYDVWMYENVLKPIGMVNSTYAQPPAPDKHARCATGYYRDGSPVLGKFRVYPEQAAAGLWKTPSDLAQYIIDIQLALKGGKSKILSPEMLQLHTTPYNGGPAAMGTFIEDHDGAKYFQHSAGNDGFCGIFYGSFEGGDGVAVFMNGEGYRLLSEVVNCVAKVYGWKNFYREPKRRQTEKPIEVSTRDLEKYAGIYLFDDQWATVEKKDNKYYFHTDGTYANMYFTSLTSFYNEEFAAVKTFLSDEKGQITGYTRTVDGKEYPGARKITNLDTLHMANHLFGNITWHFIETKDFEQAVAFCKRGAELYPSDLNLLMNAAHAHLLKGDFDKALAIHKAHLNDVVRPGLTWPDLLRSDFTYLKEHQMDAGKFDRLFAELKVEKPKGY